jgi:hypothetical protein
LIDGGAALIGCPFGNSIGLQPPCQHALAGRLCEGAAARARRRIFILCDIIREHTELWRVETCSEDKVGGPWPSRGDRAWVGSWH